MRVGSFGGPPLSRVLASVTVFLFPARIHAVTVEDRENAYTIYARERRVARFGHSSLIRRVGTERLSSLVGGL
jgi:hypothetical protein